MDDGQHIANIANAATDHQVVAIRRQEAAACVGDELDWSYRWIDGETTDETLYGTCAVLVRGEGDTVDGETCALALGAVSQYPGETVVLIGGSFVSWGEDSSEVVVGDAVVLAVL